MKKVMIIDGSSLLYRAFFALPPLNNALGVPTNAVYGFLTMLVKLFDRLNPDYVAVAFDKGKVTFRTELYEDYKGNRPNAPDDLRPQFGLIREVLTALGLCVIEEEGFEGDDIIGSLSKRFGSDDTAVYIVTGDRDSLQLVDQYSTVFLTKKGISEMQEVTPSTMPELYGYGPDKVVDMKALMGDSSDNIPGVPGVGEKTALKLITQFETLDGVYEHLEEVSGKKLKEKLADNKDQAYLSKVLATIKTDMELPYQLTDFVPSVHISEVRPLFDKLGFHSITPRILAAMGAGQTDSESLFEAFAVDPEPAKEITHVDVVPTEALKAQKVAVRVMAKGQHPFRTVEKAYLAWGDEVVCLNGDTGLLDLINTVPIVVTEDSKLLAEVLGDTVPANIQYYVSEKDIVHDFTENSLEEAKTATGSPSDSFTVVGAVANDKQPRILDLTLMAYLADPTRTNYGITYLIERFGGSPVPTSGDDAEYAGEAQSLLVMADSAVKTLKEAALWALYSTIELPLVHTLMVMEKNGIYIEPSLLATTTEQFKAEAAALQAKIYEAAGEEFNINSPKQLGSILFEKLGLRIIKKTKTGYSTDAEVLAELQQDHPIVAMILAYRTVVKLVSTYLDGLKPLINERTQRIHTTFNQMVTATGRLSSSDPNLQNIPVRTEKGREIRALFLPGAGYDTLISADYSQIELRILAHLSEDPALMKAFADGLDIHRFTAAEVLGKKPEEVTSTERSHAKAVNFGIIYGISDFGLSRDLGITRAAAKEYIELYFSRYPKVKAYMDNMVAMAHETGSVRTLFGRVRALPDINSRNFNRRSFAERTAMNTPIQGTAADIIKLAMNEVVQRMTARGLKSRLLLQVHDELVVEATHDEADIVRTLLADTMDSIVKLKVPLIVDVHQASDWASVK